ncbi:hypothetical protein T08_7153 [Trichinella sp. T8]|nr:hypothetical protein T08_7153 [Trichinella sp. T8]
MEVDLVKSACNKANELTRVPRRWLKPPAAGPALVCAATADLGVERMIADVHLAMGHPGIRRTLYFARRTKIWMPCVVISRRAVAFHRAMLRSHATISGRLNRLLRIFTASG